MNTKTDSDRSNISGGNSGKHGNASGTNGALDSNLHMEFKQVKYPADHQKNLVKDPIGGVDSIIESILVLPSIISPDGPDQIGINGGGGGGGFLR